MCILCIDGGKIDKLCLGDIFGVLIGDVGLLSKFIGKIVIFLICFYVVIVCE